MALVLSNLSQYDMRPARIPDSTMLINQGYHRPALSHLVQIRLPSQCLLLLTDLQHSSAGRHSLSLCAPEMRRHIHQPGLLEHGKIISSALCHCAPALHWHHHKVGMLGVTGVSQEPITTLSLALPHRLPLGQLP